MALLCEPAILRALASYESLLLDLLCCMSADETVACKSVLSRAWSGLISTMGRWEPLGAVAGGMFLLSSCLRRMAPALAGDLGKLVRSWLVK